MKKLFVFMFSCILTSVLFADATSRYPLIIKESGTLDSQLNPVKQYECLIYSTKMVINTNAGGVTLSREVPISLDGALIGLIREASVGQIKQDTSHGTIEHSPYVRYYAYNIAIEDSAIPSTFVLYETTQKLSINTSSEAKALRQLLDMNCK